MSNKEKCLQEIKKRTIVTDNGCWKPKTKGRGLVRPIRDLVPEGIRYRQQAAYWASTGYIPKAWTYAVCGLSRCCNPVHLESSETRSCSWLRTIAERTAKVNRYNIISWIKVNSRDFWAMDRAGIIRWDLHRIHPVWIKRGEMYKVKVI